MNVILNLLVTEGNRINKLKLNEPLKGSSSRESPEGFLNFSKVKCKVI